MSQPALSVSSAGAQHSAAASPFASRKRERPPPDVVLERTHPQPATSYVLDDVNRFRLGRSSGCDAVLTGALVSRAHAELTRVADPATGAHEWLVWDLSANGIYLVRSGLAPERLVTGHPHTLADGDEFSLGSPGALGHASFRWRAGGAAAGAADEAAADAGAAADGAAGGAADGAAGGAADDADAYADADAVYEASYPDFEDEGEGEGECQEEGDGEEEEAASEEDEVLRAFFERGPPGRRKKRSAADDGAGAPAAAAAAGAEAAAADGEHSDDGEYGYLFGEDHDGAAAPAAADGGEEAAADDDDPDATPEGAPADATRRPNPFSIAAGTSSMSQADVWVAGPSRAPAPAAGGGGGGAGGVAGFAERPREQARAAGDAAGARWLEGGGALATQWGAPPFSVLDARKGYWKKRRQFWESRVGLASERGRGDNLLGYKGLGGGAARGTSVFCPVLTELMMRWFCPAGGRVLDPFAGGSVRGCVAGRLGLAYHGVDLSAAQVAENRAQAAAIAAAATRAGKSWRLPSWTAADARELATLDALPPRFDFVFSCPPYYDLEQYSDDPRDLSKAPTYAAFLDAYRAIVADAVARLERGRFACFVVGEVRDADGFMHSLVADTIAAFAAAGGRLYNHAVMMLPLHSLPMRAPAAFKASAKLGMCHQHVLVFYCGGKSPKAELLHHPGLKNAMRPQAWA